MNTSMDELRKDHGDLKALWSETCNDLEEERAKLEEHRKDTHKKLS